MGDKITTEDLCSLLDKTVKARLIKEQLFYWGYTDKKFYEELFGIELSDVDEQMHEDMLWVRFDNEVDINGNRKDNDISYLVKG